VYGPSGFDPYGINRACKAVSSGGSHLYVYCHPNAAFPVPNISISRSTDIPRRCYALAVAAPAIAESLTSAARFHCWARAQTAAVHEHPWHAGSISSSLRCPPCVLVNLAPLGCIALCHCFGLQHHFLCVIGGDFKASCPCPLSDTVGYLVFGGWIRAKPPPAFVTNLAYPNPSPVYNWLNKYIRLCRGDFLVSYLTAWLSYFLPWSCIC